MSGSESITIASTAAMIAALISLLTISRAPPFLVVVTSLLSPWRARLGQDLLHRPHRVRQSLRHLIGQAHAGADVGGLAGHQQAPPGPAAQRDEQREDAVRRQGVRRDDPGGQRSGG